MNLLVIAALVAGAGYFVGKFLFKKDQEIEDRRRGAARLAGVLASLGLRETPEFLIDYSVGDYSGMGTKIKSLASLFLSGQEAVLGEFKQVFEACLTAKLSDENGRAYVAARLADATLESDPSVVRDAPAATVKPLV